MTTQVNHGFDGEDHPHFELQPPVFLTEIRDLRIFVKSSSDTVTDELPYHAETKAFNIILDSQTNVENPIPFAALVDPSHHPLVRHFDELAGFLRDVSYGYCSSGVSIPPLMTNAKVQSHNVAVFQNSTIRRKTMNHFFVHGNTQRPGKSAVAFKCRLHTQLLAPPFGVPIQLSSRDPGARQKLELIENSCDRSSRDPHILELSLGLENHHP